MPLTPCGYYYYGHIWNLFQLLQCFHNALRMIKNDFPYSLVIIVLAVVGLVLVARLKGSRAVCAIDHKTNKAQGESTGLALKGPK